MEQDQKHKLGAGIVFAGLMAAILLLWNENAKLKQEIKRGNTYAVNVPAPDIRASCPTVPPTTITIYRNRACQVSSQPATATLLPTGNREGIDDARLRELARQADDIVSAVRSQ